MTRLPGTTHARLACILLGSLMLVALVHPRVEAETWRVERDGSGDFTTIQPAIDAAAEGDTILIGPGRYAEMVPDHVGNPSVGALSTRALTFIGTSRDQVLIGPDPSTPIVGFTRGFSQVVADLESHYERLTIENLSSGLSVLGSVTVRDCLIQHCVIGLNAVADLEVEGSEFHANQHGIWASGSAEFGLGESLVRNSTFVDCVEDGVISQFHTMRVEDSEFRRCGVGFRQSQGKTGSAVSCVFVENDTGILATLSGHVSLLDCRVGPGHRRGVFLSSESHLSGTGNRLEHGSLHTLDLWERSTAAFHGNDILLGENAAVRLVLYEVDAPVDLSNNYWGTTDLELIDEKILDKEEQVGVITEVIFEPILMRSVPTGKETFSGLKSMFRGKN